MVPRGLLFLVPPVAFLIVAGGFLWGLNPARDPSELPSVLIDDPVAILFNATRF